MNLAADLTHNCTDAVWQSAAFRLTGKIARNSDDNHVLWHEVLAHENGSFAIPDSNRLVVAKPCSMQLIKPWAELTGTVFVCSPRRMGRSGLLWILRCSTDGSASDTSHTVYVIPELLEKTSLANHKKSVGFWWAVGMMSINRRFDDGMN